MPAHKNAVHSWQKHSLCQTNPWSRLDLMCMGRNNASRGLQAQILSSALRDGVPEPFMDALATLHAQAGQAWAHLLNILYTIISTAKKVAKETNAQKSAGRSVVQLRYLSTLG